MRASVPGGTMVLPGNTIPEVGNLAVHRGQNGEQEVDDGRSSGRNDELTGEYIGGGGEFGHTEGDKMSDTFGKLMGT
jgi:hypothetical protein